MINNNTDFIYYKEKGLSKEKCNLIIDLFNKEEDQFNVLPGLIGPNAGRVDEKMKKCVEIYNKLSEENEYNGIFLDELEKTLNEYKKEHPFIEKGISAWRINNIYKIQKYKPGEAYFELHCETNCSIESSVNQILVWMIYLNDVTDGGYTEFPSQNKLLQPKSGSIIIWPSYWTHPHRGITSKTQTKYIMTGWWSFVK